MGFLSDSKDRIVERLTREAVNRSRFQRYGRLTALRIHSGEKWIAATAQLHGEPEPLEVRLEGYQITRKEDRYFLSARRMVTSREWLNTLAADFFVTRAVELPPEAARIAAQVL